jgi:hypothetical protein
VFLGGGLGDSRVDDQFGPDASAWIKFLPDNMDTPGAACGIHVNVDIFGWIERVRQDSN